LNSDGHEGGWGSNNSLSAVWAPIQPLAVEWYSTPTSGAVKCGGAGGGTHPRSQAYGNFVAAKLVRAQEVKRGFEYSWVIRLRPDVVWASQWPTFPWPLVTAQKVMISAYNTEGSGVSDVWALLSRAGFEVYAEEVFYSWNNCVFAEPVSKNERSPEGRLGQVRFDV
jgi:hypothetical protein